MRYFYFVSYATGGRPGGFGYTELIRDMPIEHIKDVKDIAALISVTLGGCDVGILNWILLRTEKDEKPDSSDLTRDNQT